MQETSLISEVRMHNIPQLAPPQANELRRGQCLLTPTQFYSLFPHKQVGSRGANDSSRGANASKKASSASDALHILPPLPRKARSKTVPAASATPSALATPNLDLLPMNVNDHLPCHTGRRSFDNRASSSRFLVNRLGCLQLRLLLVLIVLWVLLLPLFGLALRFGFLYEALQVAEHHICLPSSKGGFRVWGSKRRRRKRKRGDMRGRDMWLAHCQSERGPQAASLGALVRRFLR